MTTTLHQNLTDLPNAITGPSAWRGKEMRNNREAWL